MKKLALLIAILSCMPAAQAEDIKPTADRTSVSLEVKWLPQASVKRICTELGAWGGVLKHSNAPVGCTVYVADTNTCTAYMSRPEEVDDLKTLTFGHEVLHCLEGSYHGQEKL